MFKYMEDKIEKRIINCAKYIIDTHATVRTAALFFGIGKSTVHNDMQVKLKLIDPALYEEVKRVLETNKQF